MAPGVAYLDAFSVISKASFKNLRGVTCTFPYTPQESKCRVRYLVSAPSNLHSGQTQDARSSRHTFTKENTDKCRKFHFNCKTQRSFYKLQLFCVCVQNDVTVIYNFCRREIRFARTFSVSFSSELRARKHLI